MAVNFCKYPGGEKFGQFGIRAYIYVSTYLNTFIMDFYEKALLTVSFLHNKRTLMLLKDQKYIRQKCLDIY